MNSLRTADSQLQQHGHVPIEIFKQGAQAITASTGHSIVATKKAGGYKQGMIVQQRPAAI